jgi:DHA1 family inner membrane transport protein
VRSTERLTTCTVQLPDRWLVGMLTAAVFASSTFWLSLSPFLPILAEELSTSIGLLGQIPALLTLLAAVLGAAVGPLAERVGHRRTLLIGLLGVVLACVATGLVQAYAFLLVAALFGALGRAAVLPVAQAAVASAFTEEARWRAISRVSAGISAAAILGVPLMTSVASVFPWRVAFLGLAGVALVIGLAVWMALGRDELGRSAVESAGSGKADFSSVLQQRATLGLVGATFLSLMATWTVLTYAGAFFVQRHGLGVREVGWVFTANGLALLVGTLLAGWRLGGLPARPVIIVSRAGNGLLLGLSLMLPLGVPQSVALLALGALLAGVGGAATAALLADETSTGRATALALNGSAMNLGTAFGASLGGVVLVASGYAALGWCAAVCALGAGMLVWLTRPRTRSLPPPAVAAPAG